MPTQGDPITLGTIDLRAFCDCGSPCEDCCIDKCGCVGMPTTLYAHVRTTAGCSAIDDVVTLTYDSGTGHWASGSVTLGCGDAIGLTLRCQGAAAACTDFRLDVAFGCAAIGPTYSPSFCTCPPAFEADFVIAGAVYLGPPCTCCPSVLVTIEIEITA